MELMNKIEKTVLGWVKDVPHLPSSAQKWIAVNVWWMVLVSAILGALGVLFSLNNLVTLLALLDSASNLYYVTTTYTEYAIVRQIISLVLGILTVVVLSLAINPLKLQQKKGWVLLFLALLLGIVSLVINAVLSLSILGFIISVIFGGIFLVALGYFLFEIHGQFAHVPRRTKKTQQ